jgi:hypothetical protein
MIQKPERNRRFPFYGFAALLLMLISWYFNWTLDGLRTHFLFFPLWLGYCLLVDALVKWRKGHSLLSRDLKKYVSLFLISIPVWWFFELVNLRTQNWEYLGREHFSDLEYFLFASLSFSTVIPAVFGTAELVSTFTWMKERIPGPRIPATRQGLWVLFVIGWIALLLMLFWPDYFFPFVWVSVFLLFDVINHWLGYRSLVAYSDQRNWRPMISLALGCLVCGFFWEMWNYYAFPKWIYHIPGVDFFHVFEMPLPGYLGYIPFSFELFAFYHLMTRTKTRGEDYYYVQV